MLKLLLILLCCLPLTACAGAEGELTLTAVNVGKADALILAGGDSVYLIDTGTAESWPRLSRALKAHDIRRLDGVILTHTDKDHAGGALALAMSSVQVDHWYAPRWYTRKEDKHPGIQAAAWRGQEITWLQGGDSLPLAGGSLKVLGPIRESEKENNNSLVLLAEGGGGRMLLAGDMEFPEEQSLLEEGLIPRCQVLKVGNHGEDDATSPALVRAVSPSLALISTSTREEPDTPASRVTALLSGAGARILETQQAEAGVMVRMAGGKAEASLMAWLPAPKAPVGLELTKLEDDAIRIDHRGEQTVALTDWFLTSQRGGELFVFPEGAQIAPGESLTIVSRSSEGSGDYLWPEKKVWHRSKPDAATLYDPYGQAVATVP